MLLRTGLRKTVASGADIAPRHAGARDARAVGFSRFPKAEKTKSSPAKPKDGG